MKVDAVPRQAQYLALTHTGEQCQDEQRFKSVSLYSGQKCGDLRRSNFGAFFFSCGIAALASAATK